jgi:hypothetical protein
VILSAISKRRSSCLDDEMSRIQPKELITIVRTCTAKYGFRGFGTMLCGCSKAFIADRQVRRFKPGQQLL